MLSGCLYYFTVWCGGVDGLDGFLKIATANAKQSSIAQGGAGVKLRKMMTMQTRALCFQVTCVVWRIVCLMLLLLLISVLFRQPARGNVVA